MNLIKQLYEQSRKEELIGLFEIMQEEIRQLNSDKMKLQEELNMCRDKIRHYRRRLNAVLSERPM